MRFLDAKDLQRHLKTHFEPDRCAQSGPSCAAADCMVFVELAILGSESCPQFTPSVGEKMVVGILHGIQDHDRGSKGIGLRHLLILPQSLGCSSGPDDPTSYFDLHLHLT